jgi:hypothetical protein
MTNDPRCPRCGGALVPIVYGLPTRETELIAARGAVALGGCVIHDGAPRWRCRACGESTTDSDSRKGANRWES